MSEEKRTSDSLEQSIDRDAENIGAVAGSAVGGSAGTVLGAAAGSAASVAAKPIVKAIILIVLVIVMVFSSLPSMFFENPIDIADNTGPTEVYGQLKHYVMERYRQELERHKEEIEWDFWRRVSAGEFRGYDSVEFSFSFNPPEDVFLAELTEASTLIIAMFEISTDDWRRASFSDFRRAVSSVHFWHDTIIVENAGEEHTVTYTTHYDKDGNSYEESTIHVHINFSIFDNGVEVFRARFNLDEREFLRGVEMAHNIRVFFGGADNLPPGGVSGGAAGSFPGGGTHNTIRQALAGLYERREFFGGHPVMPLPPGSWRVTSEFGPRNFAPDPIHTGIDFAAARGTPIFSVMDGIVLLRLTNMRTFGHHIVIYHGGGVTTMYAHLTGFGFFNIGDEVSRGDVIGYVGTTGLSTGYHLHFEYQRNGSAFNPRLILPF